MLNKSKKIGMTVIAVLMVVGAVRADAWSLSGTSYTRSWLGGRTFERDPYYSPPVSYTPIDDPACEVTKKPILARASSYADWNTRPELAIDQQTNTTWKSQSGAPQWLEVELDGEYTVSGVRLHVNQSPDANAYPKPTPAYHQVYVGLSVANSSAAVLSQDLYNGVWKKLDFISPVEHVNVIRINTVNSPSSQVAWNEVEVCVKPPVALADTQVNAFIGGYEIVSACFGNYASIHANSSVPAYIGFDDLRWENTPADRNLYTGPERVYLQPHWDGSYYGSITASINDFPEATAVIYRLYDLNGNLIYPGYGAISHDYDSQCR